MLNLYRYGKLMALAETKELADSIIDKELKQSGLVETSDAVKIPIKSGLILYYGDKDYGELGS